MKEHSEKNNKSQEPLSWIIRLYKKLLDSGIMAILPSTAIKLYTIMLTHRITNQEGFTLSSARLMDESGIKKPHTFFNCLNILKATGLIKWKRGPKKFNYINRYYIPLNPMLTMMELKVELRIQKERRTLMPKKGTSIDEETQEKGTPPLMPKKGTSIDEETQEKGTPPLMPKKGTSINKKTQKKGAMPKKGTPPLMPKKGTSNHVKDVKDVLRQADEKISSRKKPKSEKKSKKRAEKPKIECGEKAWDAKFKKEKKSKKREDRKIKKSEKPKIVADEEPWKKYLKKLRIKKE